MATVVKNVVLSAAKIANKKCYKNARIFLQFVGDRFIYRDIDHTLEISLYDNRETELSYSCIEELELYSQFAEETVPTARHGKDFQSSDFCEALLWCALATDQESTRYQLSGVCWDDMHLVSTDGRRMHIANIGQCFVQNIPAINAFSSIIPVRAVNAICGLVKLFKDDILSVCIDASIGTMTVHGECWKFTFCLGHGRFPDWKAVCGEKDIGSQLDTMNTEDVRKLAAHSIKGNKLSQDIHKRGLSKKELKEYKEQFPKISIEDVLYNANYIRDAIDTIENECFFAYRKDSHSPIFIGDRTAIGVDGSTTPRMLAVVMPMTK